MLYLRANQTIDAEGDLLVAVQEAFQLWGMSLLTNAVCEPTGMYLDCRLREQGGTPPRPLLQRDVPIRNHAAFRVGWGFRPTDPGACRGQRGTGGSGRRTPAP